MLQVNPTAYPEGVDIYDARCQVIRRLIRLHYDNSQSAFGRDAGLSPSYVTRMLHERDNPQRKKIGERLALRIEESLKLPHGTLLHPEFSGDEQANDAETEPAREPQVLIARRLDPDLDPAQVRELIMGWSEILRALPRLKRSMVHRLMGLVQGDPDEDQQVAAEIERLVHDAWTLVRERRKSG